jgi:hypothetical protein
MNEGMFKPVLSIKKVNNPYHKKHKSKAIQGNPTLWVDLKFDSGRESGSEDDDAKLYFPPIKSNPLETKTEKFNTNL